MKDITPPLTLIPYIGYVHSRMQRTYQNAKANICNRDRGTDADMRVGTVTMFIITMVQQYICTRQELVFKSSDIEDSEMKKGDKDD